MILTPDKGGGFCPDDVVNNVTKTETCNNEPCGEYSIRAQLKVHNVPNESVSSQCVLGLLYILLKHTYSPRVYYTRCNISGSIGLY